MIVTVRAGEAYPDYWTMLTVDIDGTVRLASDGDYIVGYVVPPPDGGPQPDAGYVYFRPLPDRMAQLEGLTQDGHVVRWYADEAPPQNLA